ncbi:MAG: AraC family transcriptional regulator ligand-binding domain-containing protein [Nevskia sp.]|nr:AraC family transcriptional regulator ligand-binding domain-containing protein [Nevskia sp.]
MRAHRPEPGRQLRDSGSLLQIVHAGMVAAGLDVSAIYRRLGCGTDFLDRRGLRTPHDLQIPFWEAAEAVSGDADVGLHLCPHLPVYRGEVLEYLFFSSRSFREGLVHALRCLRLVSDAVRISWTQDAAELHLAVSGSPLQAPQVRHTDICAVYQTIRFVRSVTEHRYAPLRVRLRCARGAAQADYERVFGCPVEFEAERSLVSFDAALLEYRSPRRDPDLLLLHAELAQKRLAALERQDLIERIRVVFSRRLDLEQCELEEVARELGVPARRLRFDLACAGTNFSELLTDFRYSLARRLLRGSDEPIQHVVYITGFSEPGSFYRAFKRWSGMSPAQYRRQSRSPSFSN